MTELKFDRTKYLSVKEAAASLGYFPPYINRLIREGRIEAVKRGRQYFVTPEEINKLVCLPVPKKVEELI